MACRPGTVKHRRVSSSLEILWRTQLRTSISLARLWQSQGKRQGVYELLAPVYDWFTEGSTPRICRRRTPFSPNSGSCDRAQPRQTGLDGRVAGRGGRQDLDSGTPFAAGGIGHASQIRRPARRSQAK
jgi:hypothetical protein